LLTLIALTRLETAEDYSHYNDFAEVDAFQTTASGSSNAGGAAVAPDNRRPVIDGPPLPSCPAPVDTAENVKDQVAATKKIVDGKKKEKELTEKHKDSMDALDHDI